ncbi:MAG TPA: tetratricopeptide repeat protein [Tepidisphaeraceae bacterium]|jgi:tetratricopeptide (TPR) repeat protein|nr:tetratricopeptide repeat protein [Tepidisphaeraceae bacterium]
MPKQNTIVVALLSTAVATATLLVGCKSSGRQQGSLEAIDLYVAGVRAYQSGDQDAAITNLRAATEANTRLIMAATLLGNLYKSQGEYDKAREVYERVAQLDPYTPDNHYSLGLTYQLLDQLEQATSSYQRLLQLEPDHFEGNMNLGSVRLAMNDPDEALRTLRKATEINPKNAAAWANLGVALDAKGDFPEAEKAYRTSIDLRSDQRSTLMNLGANLVRQKKASEAIPVLEQALSQSDDPFARKLYGDALAQAGRLDEALKQYDAALKQNGRYANALAEKGNTLIAKYKKGLELDETLKTAAVDAWNKSLEINPQQARVRESLEQWNKQGM